MTVRKRFKKIIKSQDMFGHIVNLNFNKNGSEHTTFIGGFTSGIIKIFISFYVLILLQRTIWFEDNKNTSTLTVIDLIEEDRDVTMYNETNLVVFHRLSK